MEWKERKCLKPFIVNGSREITFRLYVVFMIPNRSLLFPSAVGRTNITVAFSMLAVRSPFDSEIACHAKLRSKYSFLADSVFKWQGGQGTGGRTKNEINKL